MSLPIPGLVIEIDEVLELREAYKRGSNRDVGAF
jgi:hypothetical protein